MQKKKRPQSSSLDRSHCCVLTREMQKHETSKLIMSFFFVLLATFTSATTTSCTIVLGNDGSADALHLLVLLLDLLCISFRIGIKPRLTVLQCVHNLFLFLGIQLLAETLVLTRSLNC